MNGAVVEKRDDLKRQSVGTGIGVLGTEKKISTTAQGGTYVAVDALSPPLLDTFNMRANVLATCCL